MGYIYEYNMTRGDHEQQGRIRTREGVAYLSKSICLISKTCSEENAKLQVSGLTLSE